MLMVLVATATGMTLAVGWLASQDNSSLMAANATNAASARATAQCGLELAVALLESEAPWQNAHDDGWIIRDHPIGSGSLDIRLVDTMTGLPPDAATTSVRIEASGRTDTMVQQATAVATVHPFDADSPGDLSGYALFAADRLRMTGGARVRSWGGNHGGQRIVASLGSVDVSGRAARDLRRGDVALHVAADDFADAPDSAAQAALPLVLGQVGPDAIDLPAAFELDGDHPPEDFVLGTWSTHTVEDPVLIVDDLHLRRNATLVIAQDCEIHVTGDLELDRNAAIAIDEGVQCTFIVEGDVELDGAVIGAPQDDSPRWGIWRPAHITRTNPERIRIVAPADSHSAEWSIDDGSLVQGVLEAPSADIEIDRSTVSGRVVADSIHLRRAARVYFDHDTPSGTGLAALTQVTHRHDLMDVHDGGLDGTARTEMLGRLIDLLSRAPDSSITAPVDGWWVHRPIPVDASMERMGGDVESWETAYMASVDADGERP